MSHLITSTITTNTTITAIITTLNLTIITTTTDTITSSHADFGDSGQYQTSQNHYYNPSTSGQESYNIVIDYEFEYGAHYYHSMVYKENHGFEYYDEEGNMYYDGWFATNEEWLYCRLNEPETSATPSASIINEFITNGPFEVMTQQVSTSDVEGKSSITITPPHTGAYVSIVQSEIANIELCSILQYFQ